MAEVSSAISNSSSSVSSLALPPRDSFTSPTDQDLDAAVAALHASGDDIEALSEAVIKYEWLEGCPGAYRQKFRAARSRLRKLLLASATGSGNVSRSPHTKAEYSLNLFDPLIKSYDKLNWRMVSKPGGATVRPDDFYRLYALHMQATQGDNTAERAVWAERGGLDFEGRARWDAYQALKGLTQEKAKHRFVRLFHEFPATALYKDTRAQVISAAEAETEVVAPLPVGSEEGKGEERKMGDEAVGGAIAV